MDTILQQLPPELSGFVLTLVLALLIGLEREEHEPLGLGGVRTFPIIGLGGFLLATAFTQSVLPFAAGLLVLGALVAMSYWFSLRTGETGLTTEVTALLTFALGGAAARGLFWISIAAGVVAVILLQEKIRLERLAVNLPQNELRTVVRFLLLTGVILPAVPNRPFTAFNINPFTIWLVVVAVSGISYLSYLLQRYWRREGGLLLAGTLGGAYSSTVTTVALARASRQQLQPAPVYAGAIVAATGMMYLRLWVLIALFAPALASELTALFLGLGFAAVAFGALIGRRRGSPSEPAEAAAVERRRQTTNPLELSSAIAFALIFLAVIVLTDIVAASFGGTGLVVMAAIMGATDVDPFILGLTQQPAGEVAIATAALAIVVAAAANNVMKGLYAFAFGPRRVGVPVLAALVALAAASVTIYLVAG